VPADGEGSGNGQDANALIALLGAEPAAPWPVPADRPVSRKGKR